MNYSQKFGVVVMIVSFLLILLSLIISTPWLSQLSFFENLMDVHIYLFEYQDKSTGYFHQVIDVETKYIVFLLVTIASYGLTTFLEITPSFKP